MYNFQEYINLQSFNYRNKTDRRKKRIMELTQRRPSGYSTSRPEKLGSKKMGSNTFHSVVARARKSTLERVSMLTSVDDADMDNELLFESFVGLICYLTLTQLLLNT